MPTRTAEIRRPEIVQAVIEAMQAAGLPYPSYDTVAGSAGMSRQLIRHYMPDPEELMVLTCEALAEAYKDCLLRGILRVEAPQRLTMFLDFYFDMLADEDLAKPADDRVYDAMFALAARSDTLRRRLHDQYQLLRMTVSHEVKISHPALPHSACDEIGFLFVGLMYGHWKMVASLGFDRSLNRVSREAMDRLIESYLARYDDPAQRPLAPRG